MRHLTAHWTLSEDGKTLNDAFTQYLPDGMTLFISGTASIVGHQSIHVGDTAAQTRETLTNIEALLEEANRVTGSNNFKLDTLACKVYVRHPCDLPVIQSELRTALGPEARAVYLQADICRGDLSVEIEATAMVTKHGEE